MHIGEPKPTVNTLNPRASSTDTPVHAFIPAWHVDHMHPNFVIAIAASRRSQELTREIFRHEIGWTPWMRPGFVLEIQRRCQAKPQMKGLVPGRHGLVNWADDDRECYRLTVRIMAADVIETRRKA